MTFSITQVGDHCQPHKDFCHFKNSRNWFKIFFMFPHEFTRYTIFNGFTCDELDFLNSFMELIPYKANQVIFDQGSRADYLYILLRGEVNIYYKPYDGPPITVASIEPGSVFGWSAIVGREEYTSKANTLYDSLTFRILGDNVKLICNQYPHFGNKFIDRLMCSMTDRINHSHFQVRDLLSQEMKIIDTYLGRKIKND